MKDSVSFWLIILSDSSRGTSLKFYNVYYILVVSLHFPTKGGMKANTPINRGFSPQDSRVQIPD